VDLIAEGVPTEIDTAEINGETFLCQCSAGLVPRLAEERENVRDESWWRSLLYLPRRFRRSVLHLRRRKMRIAFPDESHEVETWLAVVTNNRPDQPFSLMLQRGRLDRGTLAVHWAQVSSRWGLLWLLLSYILNWMNTNPQVQIRDAESVKITSDRDGLKVDLDGEIRHMQGPLHYRIRPKSLRVLMPAQKALT
jgi:diacylglycerol kinase family enzyme